MIWFGFLAGCLVSSFTEKKPQVILIVTLISWDSQCEWLHGQKSCCSKSKYMIIVSRIFIVNKWRRKPLVSINKFKVCSNNNNNKKTYPKSMSTSRTMDVTDRHDEVEPVTRAMEGKRCERKEDFMINVWNMVEVGEQLDVRISVEPAHFSQSALLKVWRTRGQAQPVELHLGARTLTENFTVKKRSGAPRSTFTTFFRGKSMTRYVISPKTLWNWKHPFIGH